MKPVQDGVHVREDVWKLAPWDDTLLWYAKATASLRGRSITDPLSWRFQAAVHAYVPSRDPLAVKDEELPSSQVQKRFWGRCQHGSWHFLPWHRAYLACFEQIVRAEIVKLGGPNAWALPYWNYSDPDNPTALLVRPEFRDEKLPDGSPNALADAERGVNEEWAEIGAKTGDYGLSEEDAALDCLKRGNFDTKTTSGVPSFGGGQMGFAHNGSAPGHLEIVPHGSVHGGVGGWLGAFNTAGLDPLFWLHHANIDRLWEVWLKRDGSLENPTDPAWMQGPSQPFEFHDASGQPVSISPKEVVDTTVPLLGYRYESTDDPLAQAGLAMANVVSAPKQANLAGASDVGVNLSSASTSVKIALDSAVTDGAALDGSGQTFLNVENVTGLDNAAAYRVFVNIADAAALSEDHYAGLLPMFGVAEASRRDDDHGGAGLNFVLDITELVERLKAEGNWRPDDLDVTFVPKRPSGSADIKVGRVSLYVG